MNKSPCKKRAMHERSVQKDDIIGWQRR